MLHFFVTYFILCFIEIYLSNLHKIYPVNLTILAPLPERGIATPHKRRVASICSLCAGTIYIVFLGSPTGLIPWFHN